MFSNNIISIVVINIYLLVILNIIGIVSVYLVAIRNKVTESKEMEMYRYLKPYVIDYMADDSSMYRLKEKLITKKKEDIAINIMFEYMQERNISMPEKFERLGYVDKLIAKAKRKINLQTMKKLALIKSQRTVGVLFRGADSWDFEISFRCFYTLSTMQLKDELIEDVIRKLMFSEMIRDRAIEIVSNFNLPIDTLINYLEREENPTNKVIFLRVILRKKEILDKKYSEKLLKYIRSKNKEVRLSAVLVIASSKNPIYFQELIQLYVDEPTWEVRAAIAKCMAVFKPKLVVDHLKDMMYDESWWVRFNAVEVLAKIGVAGLNALIELSLDKKNTSVSNLAYYALSANREVYRTVQNASV